MSKTQLNRIIYLAYNWATVVLWMIFIWWLASISTEAPDASLSISSANQLLIYGFLFLLIYKALLSTFKFKIERLAFWRSKQELSEDEEFVFIVETLLLIISILVSIIFAVVDEYNQSLGTGSFASARDVILDTIGILVFSLVTYSMPIITEIEVFIVRKVLHRK